MYRVEWMSFVTRNSMFEVYERLDALHRNAQGVFSSSHLWKAFFTEKTCNLICLAKALLAFRQHQGASFEIAHVLLMNGSVLIHDRYDLADVASISVVACRFLLGCNFVALCRFCHQFDWPYLYREVIFSLKHAIRTKLLSCSYTCDTFMLPEVFCYIS